MAIDRNLLRQVSAKTTPPQSGIAGLIRGIHRLPELRDWVTFETIALPPIPVIRSNEWVLVSLLTVSKQSADGNDGYAVPWGVVEWAVPTMQVVQKLDLRSIKADNPLWKPQIISDLPADVTIALTPQTRNIYGNALFAHLDDFCSNTTKTAADFAELAPYYSGILPREFYAYYHDLVPESQQWLSPDVPAMTIDPLLGAEMSADVNFTRSKAHPKILRNLSARLDEWLKQCAAIAKELPGDSAQQTEHLLNLLTEIDKRRILPGFRLAFVGEFSRGKSQTIDRLLATDILPKGALPTTATLTSIVAGDPEQMEVRINGEIQIRSLTEISWEDLLATDEAGSEQEVFAGVRISLNHQWLRSLDLEIIDTPGAGDLSERRINLVCEVLNQCDAAVLVIDANSPFSMTEAAFLEQEVIGRHIPRVMVVVTKLDTIALAERSNLMQNICRRIANVASDLAILPTYPIDDSHSEADALAEIITQIETLVERGDRAVWRSRQVSAQINDWLQHSIDIAQSTIAAISMSPQARTSYLQQAQNEISSADIKWGTLRIEIDTIRRKRAQELRQQMISQQDEIVDRLNFEIQKSPDLKNWWQCDLSFKLRRELTMLSRTMEGFLIKFLAEDFDTLQREVATIFNANLHRPEVAPPEAAKFQLAIEERSIPDVQKIRLLTRLGSSVVMIGGSVLGPISVVAGTSIGVVSEVLLTKKLDAQRKVLSAELNRIVEISIEEYYQKVNERLRELYQIIIDDLDRERSTWKHTKKTALTMNLSSTQQTRQDWQKIVDKAEALQQEISSSL